MKLCLLLQSVIKGRMKTIFHPNEAMVLQHHPQDTVLCGQSPTGEAVCGESGLWVQTGLSSNPRHSL